MSYLFEIQGNAVMPKAETLLVEPFKSIWKRDKSKNKAHAIEDFAYIEFMTSVMSSNPYSQYPDNRKSPQIIKEVITREGWEPDELIFKGMKYINKIQTEGSTTYQYYMAAKKAAENMKDFFNTVDIKELNPKTFNPIYKPRDITAALNDTQKVLANLKGLEKKVEEELYDEVKSRANKQVSPLADPSSLK